MYSTKSTNVWDECFIKMGALLQYSLPPLWMGNAVPTSSKTMATRTKEEKGVGRGMTLGAAMITVVLKKVIYIWLCLNLYITYIPTYIYIYIYMPVYKLRWPSMQSGGTIFQTRSIQSCSIIYHLADYILAKRYKDNSRSGLGYICTYEYLSPRRPRIKRANGEF